MVSEGGRSTALEHIMEQCNFIKVCVTCQVFIELPQQIGYKHFCFTPPEMFVDRKLSYHNKWHVFWFVVVSADSWLLLWRILFHQIRWQHNIIQKKLNYTIYIRKHNMQLLLNINVSHFIADNVSC